MTKYGIAHSTIRYYQKEADSLVRMVGSRPLLSMARRIEQDHQRMSARELGHMAISIAQHDASLLRIATPALATATVVEATELLTEAERAQVVRVAQLSASLDVMEQVLYASFPGRLVYRGGNHVALLAHDGGPRVLIVTEQAAEPVLAIQPTLTDWRGNVRPARVDETPEQFSVYQRVQVGQYAEARWVADFDHLQDARAFVQRGGK